MGTKWGLRRVPSWRQKDGQNGFPYLDCGSKTQFASASPTTPDPWPHHCYGTDDIPLKIYTEAHARKPVHTHSHTPPHTRDGAAMHVKHGFVTLRTKDGLSDRAGVEWGLGETEAWAVFLWNSDLFFLPP